MAKEGGYYWQVAVMESGSKLESIWNETGFAWNLNNLAEAGS